MPSLEGVDNDVPPKGYGVFGRSASSIGVYGSSPSREGVYGESRSGYGVYGYSPSGYGVYGYSPSGYGVYGYSDSGPGVFGESYGSDGLRGYSYSNSGSGVIGRNNRGYGVAGLTISGTGTFGNSSYGPGVFGSSSYDVGVDGRTVYGIGVSAQSLDNVRGVGLYAKSYSGRAADLDGNVIVRGNLSVNGNLSKGGGSFKIDHPLDPANKYLHHSFVESPDMKNVYDGVVVLDDKGEAEIELPNWFGALNKDFRYQLTAIGAPGPNLYIAEEISEATTTKYSNSSSNNNNNNNSRFKIAGGTSGMKVSWQVTGIRKDPWANAHRIQIEEDKPTNERGYYIYPDLYGEPEENGISNLLFSKDEREELARAAHK